jgi:hypothetical protein
VNNPIETTRRAKINLSHCKALKRHSNSWVYSVELHANGANERCKLPLHAAPEKLDWPALLSLALSTLLAWCKHHLHAALEKPAFEKMGGRA